VAGSSYGGLTINVTADTKGMRGQITSEAEAAGNEAASAIGNALSNGLKFAGQLAGSVGKAVATGLGAASAAAIGFGVASFQTAARVGEMDASLRALAKANNVSYDAMQKTVTQIRQQGIEAGTAQTLVAQFTRNQLSLADATKLATVAQDAAVISGRNSTEVLGDLVHGITTQNSMVLRNAGLNVQAGQAVEAYAKSVGKSTKDLTDAERAQAVLNATLESGKTVAGAYTEAMKEPGKVLRSFPRIIDDIKLAVGQGLVKALGPAIIGAYDLAKAFAEAVKPGGALAPIFDAIGVAVGQLVAPVTALLANWAKMIAGLKPEQISRVTDVIKQFGPAIILAAGALAAFTGAAVLTKIPILGGLLSNLLGPIKLIAGGLGGIAKSSIGAIAGLGGVGKGAGALAVVGGPVGAVIAAVVASLALLVAVSPKFRSAVVGMGQALIGLFLPAIKAVIAGIGPLIPPIMDVVRALGDNLAPIITRLTPLLAPLGQILGTQVAAGFRTLATVLGLVAPLLVGIINVLGFLINAVLAVLVPVVQFALKIVQWGSAINAVISPIGVLVGVLGGLVNIIMTVVRWIMGGSPGLIPAFLALAAVIGQVTGVISGIIGVFSALASAVASAWSAISSATSSAWSSIKSVVTSSMSAVSSAVVSGMNAARSAAVSASAGMVSAMKSAGSGMVSAITSAMSQVAGAVRSGLNAAVSAARAGGAAIMSGLSAGIQSAAGAVMSTISSVASRISGALSSALKIGSPSRLTIPMGRDLFRGLEVGYEREMDAANWAAPGLPMPPSALGGATPNMAGLGGAAGSTVINVYPQRGQDERQIAAAVSRELAWAQAGGL
jgi:hypothetical protein